MPFPPTQWTVLAGATLSGDTAARSALNDFCARYREPLAEFIEYQGLTNAEAQDAVQEFLAHFAQDSVLRRVDRAQGRFRSFLLGALKRFLARRRAYDQAAKRGGGLTALSLDHENADFGTDVSVSETDTAYFDRRWAISMLEDALREMDEEYASRGRKGAFDALADFLPGGQTPPSYGDGAAAAGMSLAQFKTEVHRLRARLREQLRARVARTVSAPHEVDEEMSYLSRVLAANHSPPD